MRISRSSAAPSAHYRQRTRMFSAGSDARGDEDDEISHQEQDRGLRERLAVQDDAAGDLRDAEAEDRHDDEPADRWQRARRSRASR